MYETTTYVIVLEIPRKNLKLMKKLPRTVLG